MLLQTNSYIVPRDKRMEHARLLRRFRQTLIRLGCDHFEVYEQVGANWASNDTTGRFVQILRFRDRRHQLEVQAAERADPTAQALIRDFCELINFPYQQQQGLFAVGFYTSFLRMPPQRTTSAERAESSEVISPSGESPEADGIGAQGAEGAAADEADDQPSPEPGVVQEGPSSVEEEDSSSQAAKLTIAGDGDQPQAVSGELIEALEEHEQPADETPIVTDDLRILEEATLEEEAPPVEEQAELSPELPSPQDGNASDEPAQVEQSSSDVPPRIG